MAAFIHSTATAVLHFMYSTQSSSSISLVSISSSVSFMKEMWLSWSQSVFELIPSAVSSSELRWFVFVFVIFLIPAGLSFLFVFSLCLKHFALRSIVSFFHVPLIVSKCQRRSSASAWSPCWISGVCVVGSKILMSALVYICRKMPRPLWFDFWSLLFPVAEM